MRGRAPASVALSAWPWESDLCPATQRPLPGFTKTVLSGCGWKDSLSRDGVRPGAGCA